LFAAISTAQLDNKMALYMTDQKVFAIKIFYSSGGSSVAVAREYGQGFSIHVALLRDTVY
jgi:hypothetical protein